jgi:hypothetical protein
MRRSGVKRFAAGVRESYGDVPGFVSEWVIQQSRQQEVSSKPAGGIDFASLLAHGALR